MLVKECAGVSFLDSECKFCGCSSHNFCRYHMLCKHFFIIFNSNLATIDDWSPLFLNQPYIILDHSMFGNNNEIDSPIWKDETPSNKMVEEVDKIHNEFLENTEHSFLQGWNPPFPEETPPFWVPRCLKQI